MAASADLVKNERTFFRSSGSRSGRNTRLRSSSFLQSSISFSPPWDPDILNVGGSGACGYGALIRQVASHFLGDLGFEFQRDWSVGCRVGNTILGGSVL